MNSWARLTIRPVPRVSLVDMRSTTPCTPNVLRGSRLRFPVSSSTSISAAMYPPREKSGTTLESVGSVCRQMNSSSSTPITIACSGIRTCAAAQASSTSFALASHAANMPQGLGSAPTQSTSAASSRRWFALAVGGDLNSEKEQPDAAASRRNAEPRSTLHASHVRVPAKAKLPRCLPENTLAAASATAMLSQ